MRLPGHITNLAAPGHRRVLACIAAALAACFFGCGDTDAGRPSAGTVQAPPNSTTATAVHLVGNGVAAFNFTRDAGGKLLDDHLSPPQYVPIEPPPAAAASTRPPSKLERTNLETLWQPPAGPTDRRMLPAENDLKERRLPLRDLPPLAASLALLPPAPALEAGPLLLTATRDAEDGFELALSPATPEAASTADPAVVPARGVANPVIASGRDGPAPFAAVAIPSPLERDVPRLPTIAAPPTDDSVFPTPGAGRNAPAMPVAEVKPAPK